MHRADTGILEREGGGGGGRGSNMCNQQGEGDVSPLARSAGVPHLCTG